MLEGNSPLIYNQLWWWVIAKQNWILKNSSTLFYSYKLIPLIHEEKLIAEMTLLFNSYFFFVRLLCWFDIPFEFSFFVCTVWLHNFLIKNKQPNLTEYINKTGERWHASVQTLVVEEQLLPLHPLPLWRTEAQHSFELGQDATGLLPLPPLPLPFLRWRHVDPRPSAFTVRVGVGHIGLPLLVQMKQNERFTKRNANFKGHTSTEILGVSIGVNRSTQFKMWGGRWTFHLTSSSGTGSLSRING